MRFFRIPAFTGIETHRDDADRGSLRTVEGCIPHGPGGLRSGPVWGKIGEVTQVSSDNFNQAAGADDDVGNSALFVSRNGEVHDMLISSKENTALVSIGSNYSMIGPGSPYWQSDAHITPIGNNLYAVGDGSVEASYSGAGPPDTQHSVFPDETIYSQEWSRFPKCQFYVQGPRKTIFASGNLADPLVIYVSEPAGMTQPVRDNPYSTPHANETPGMMSQVRILSSNATKITALSTRGDKVLVHTDKGCHILLAPSPEQASTGYRTEQVAATNTSAAVNNQVVAGDGGTQPFWLGFDGAIYKDSAATRGAEDFKSYSDPQQASWKSKGRWEQEHPNNLENSFATYDPQSGMYWVFIESSESPLNVIPLPSSGPTGLSLIASPADGPSGLSAVTIPKDGPTNLSAILQPPASGPTSLSLLTAPANGPTGLSAIQPVPASGPTGLSAVKAVVAPTNGPTGLSTSQQIFAPTSGPTGLSASQQVFAPTSGPTESTATQASTAVTCSNLSGLTTGGVHNVYWTETAWPSNAANFAFSNFTNAAVPTTLAEMNATGGSGSTCNQQMTAYFPGGGETKFQRNNGFCDIYQCWIKLTHAGLKVLNTPTGNAMNWQGTQLWGTGTGLPAWSAQIINAGNSSSNGVIWLAAAQDGTYIAFHHYGSNPNSAQGAFSYGHGTGGSCDPFGKGYVNAIGTKRGYVAAHPRNNSFQTDGVFGDAGYAWDGTSFQLDV